MNILILFLCSLPVLSVVGRPWNTHEDDRTIDIIPQLSPLMKSIDSMTISFSKALKTMSPGMVPALSVGSLAYIGYIASVMFFPSLLTRAGIPTLEDYSMESRDARSNTGFVDNLLNGFMKDIFSRTEAADVLKNTTSVAMQNSMRTLKKATRLLNVGLNSFQTFADKVIKALNPNCLLKHMCRVGQFTSVHIPALGFFLRSANTFDLDDYSQALIDGTTIGDCGAVFHSCPLDDD